MQLRAMGVSLDDLAARYGRSKDSIKRKIIELNAQKDSA